MASRQQQLESFLTFAGPEVLMCKMFSTSFCSLLGLPFPLHEANASLPLSFSWAAFQTQKNILPLKKIPPSFAVVFKTSEMATFVHHHGLPHLAISDPIVVGPLFAASPRAARWPSPCPQVSSHHMLVDPMGDNPEDLQVGNHWRAEVTRSWWTPLVKTANTQITSLLQFGIKSSTSVIQRKNVANVYYVRDEQVFSKSSSWWTDKIFCKTKWQT